MSALGSCDEDVELGVGSFAAGVAAEGGVLGLVVVGVGFDFDDLGVAGLGGDDVGPAAVHGVWLRPVGDVGLHVPSLLGEVADVYYDLVLRTALVFHAGLAVGIGTAALMIVLTTLEILSTRGS